MIYLVEKTDKQPMPEKFKTWWQLAFREANRQGSSVQQYAPLLDKLAKGGKLILPGDQGFINFRHWCQEIPGWGVEEAPDSAPLIMSELEPADEVHYLCDLPSDDPLWKYSSLMVKRYGSVIVGPN